VLTSDMNMSPEHTFVRVTKLRELSGPREDGRWQAPARATSEGSPDHHVNAGYVVDGWFLDQPRVGESMVLLRFRRNSVERLGLFTSSRVTFVGETEIHTVNSVYAIEHRSFEQHPPFAD
jgi:hypothetical protein